MCHLMWLCKLCHCNLHQYIYYSSIDNHCPTPTRDFSNTAHKHPTPSTFEEVPQDRHYQRQSPHGSDPKTQIWPPTNCQRPVMFRAGWSKHQKWNLFWCWYLLISIDILQVDRGGEYSPVFLAHVTNITFADIWSTHAFGPLLKLGPGWLALNARV